jgi:putative transposase
MAQTHVSLFIHLIFSTKNRVDLIRPEIEAELFAYIGGILRNADSKLLAANGTANHLHLLLSLNKSVLLPTLVGDIKRSSSKWLKTKGGMLNKFQWQDGYSAFSVGHTQVNDVSKYIAGQKEHHKTKLFEAEMRGFYRKYDIVYDERYVWD